MIPRKKKRPLFRRFAVNLKNVGPTVVRFISLHFVSIHASFSFCCILSCYSTVLSGHCNVSFYFLDNLGVMELHHSARHSPFNHPHHQIQLDEVCSKDGEENLDGKRFGTDS